MFLQGYNITGVIYLYTVSWFIFWTLYSLCPKIYQGLLYSSLHYEFI